jgi:membrane-bound metal-dependent hydrolase YbcI (DUF457 family)
MSGAALAFGQSLTDGLPLILLTSLFSSLPDIDLRSGGVIEHRSPLTHSVLAGVGFGLALGMAFAHFGAGFWLGFISGFLGTCFHLLGDALTFTSLRPFWPLSRRVIAFRLVKSSNPLVNWALAAIGVIAFLAYVF